MTKKKHGGRRSGAGRKVVHPEGATVPLVASVPESLVERLMAVAEKNGWNRSEAVTEAIRRMVKPPKRRAGESNPAGDPGP